MADSSSSTARTGRRRRRSPRSANSSTIGRCVAAAVAAAAAAAAAARARVDAIGGSAHWPTARACCGTSATTQCVSCDGRARSRATHAAKRGRRQSHGEMLRRGLYRCHPSFVVVLAGALGAVSERRCVAAAAAATAAVAAVHRAAQRRSDSWLTHDLLSMCRVHTLAPPTVAAVVELVAAWAPTLGAAVRDALASCVDVVAALTARAAASAPATHTTAASPTAATGGGPALVLAANVAPPGRRRRVARRVSSALVGR